MTKDYVEAHQWFNLASAQGDEAAKKTLATVPEVLAKLQEPTYKERKFEDVVKSAEKAAVLVLVY